MVTRLSQYGTMIGLSLWIVLLSACSPRALHEAQSVVTQADSMWANGQPYSDSAQLAQAYETLSSFNSPLLSTLNARLSTDFAHAGYHYGRLLRNHDDPVAAMQVFIETTHSRSHDYHILGRVYSNMGSICHLAGEFQLSYDMYEKSAEEFLRNGDTLLYYYDLNNMAFELAEQGDIVRIKTLLDSIQTYNHPQVFLKSQETLAMLHLRKKHYAETIDIINDMQAHSYTDILGYLMKSQAYEHLGRLDSAVLNARIVVSNTNDHRYLISAYYILSHKDKNLSADSVLLLTSLRADAQKEWAIRHAKYSNAAQILEQDLNRKFSWTWLYAMIVPMLVIGAGIWIYVHRKHRKHQLLSQQIDDLTQLNNAALSQHQQIVQEHTEYTNNLISQIEQNCIIITQSKDFPNNLCMKDFGAMCKIVDANFNMLASKLCHLGILNETEIRLCILAFLNANRDQISDILPYAKNGVGKLKYRVSQKMGIDGKDLKKSLMTMAINEPLKAK